MRQMTEQEILELRSVIEKEISELRSIATELECPGDAEECRMLSTRMSNSLDKLEGDIKLSLASPSIPQNLYGGVFDDRMVALMINALDNSDNIYDAARYHQLSMTKEQVENVNDFFLYLVVRKKTIENIHQTIEEWAKDRQ